MEILGILRKIFTKLDHYKKKKVFMYYNLVI